ncbi:MAG: MFS transporter [Actinobacteria bacterium]|jgi:Na+/melibiose symporter-like transporter|nr:MFS transporter [Micrococcales bacterium]MCB0903312.1 MFS transporter [Actinomycetota bacterium]MCO5299154.1 MFS transporter [Candidatus Nanopelagicales bacterium]MCB9429467.1 MFS transporter [Actinomycetota bacterium]HPE11390.1 MFS transporter [Actinomycetota bacterium]
MSNRLTGRQRYGYAVGSFGTGGFATVPGLVLLFYLTDVLGVAAAIASLVVFLPKAWDVIIAPVMGSLSDKTMLRHGTRVKWLLIGGLIIGPMFALTFAAPGALQGNAAALWVGVFFLFAVTGFATFQVTYLAMPAEFTDDYRERTRIMSIRIVFLTLSILLFGAGAPVLVNVFGGGRTGYAGMGVVVGVLLVVSTVVCWSMLRRTKSYTQAETEPTIKERFSAVRENRWFLLLMLTFVAQALGVGAMLAAVPYLATYILGGGELQQTLLFVCLVGPAIIVMPVWSMVSRRVGKHRGFLMSSAVFVTAAVGLFFSRSLPDAAIYLLVAMVGVAYAGMQMFPLAMLPDTVAADAAVHGQQRAGVFTGVWAAAETVSLALGPAVVGLILAVTGFISSSGDETVTQPGSALTGIVLSFSLFPAAMLLLSLPSLLRYDLTEVRLDQLRGSHDPAPAS